MGEVPLKRKSLVEDVERFNAHNCTETVTWADDFVWTPTDHQPSFLVGADVRDLDPLPSPTHHAHHPLPKVALRLNLPTYCGWSCRAAAAAGCCRHKRWAGAAGIACSGRSYAAGSTSKRCSPTLWYRGRASLHDARLTALLLLLLLLLL
jgi:hypothetical protein